MRPQLSWQDLKVLVKDVIDRLRPVTRELRLQPNIHAVLPPLLLDSVEIGEVTYNLVENASNYSPAGAEIQIDVRREPGTISVAVADRGPGIPASAPMYLFDPFYRVIDERPRPQGLGLGLLAENRAGGGARFTFPLPQSDAAAGISTSLGASAA